jgi:hypothetical protein
MAILETMAWNSKNWFQSAKTYVFHEIKKSLNIGGYYYKTTDLFSRKLSRFVPQSFVSNARYLHLIRLPHRLRLDLFSPSKNSILEPSHTLLHGKVHHVLYAVKHKQSYSFCGKL